MNQRPRMGASEKPGNDCKAYDWEHFASKADRIASAFRAVGCSVTRIIDQYAGHVISPELEASALRWLNDTSAQRAA